ncbi:MAG TPA: sulfotransferase [Steroidobacteraceae bacterium]|jgi:tetratricopeptide (TPR) repeat protein
MSSSASAAAIARHREVTRLLKEGNLKAAEQHCGALTSEFPQFMPGWHSRSFIELCLGRLGPALEAVGRALATSPDDARYRLQEARCLSALGRRSEAQASVAIAAASAGRDAAMLDAIGSFYSATGEQHEALQACSRALALDPDQAVFWFNRAAVRRFLGELEGAESDYDRAISLRPDDHEAYFNRSDLRKQTVERNHLAALEALLSAGIHPWRGEVQVRYALAKEYEDVGDHVSSWRQLQRGARLRREHLQYDVNYDVRTVDWIIEAFPSAQAPAADSPAGAPIFIVGLPRSGTTLVERILGSHSDVQAAGELNYFAAALVAAAQAENGQRALPRRELILATRHLDFAALGAAYLQSAQSATRERPRFTDKMPLNYLYCGLIRRALPQARIVHVRRHPMASCYAMLKTLFKDGYPFSYDLGDLASYYAGYRRLMHHWNSTMPGAIHELSYERLISDQEGETRRLLQACGLEWQDACLQFHRNPTATTTASASQVRRPMYDTSVRQWRHYEKQLEGLRAQLVSLGTAADELQ